MIIYTIYKCVNTINGKVYIGFDSQWPNRQKIKCPHCNKIGGASQMKQWHFDKCRINRPFQFHQLFPHQYLQSLVPQVNHQQTF